MNRTDSHQLYKDTDSPRGVVPLGLSVLPSPHRFHNVKNRSARRTWRDLQNAAVLTALVAGAFCLSSAQAETAQAESATSTQAVAVETTTRKKTVVMVLEPNAPLLPAAAKPTNRKTQSSTRSNSKSAGGKTAASKNAQLTRAALTPAMPVVTVSARAARTAPSVIGSNNSARMTRVDASRRELAVSPLQASSPQNKSAVVKASAGMKKVITVSSLKQLPPATQALPMVYENSRRASVIAVGLDLPAKNSQAQDSMTSNVPMIPPAPRPSNMSLLPNQLEVAAGTFVVLQTATDLDTVAIADPTIADVAVVNSRAVLVNGKTPGVTSLVIVDREKIRQYQVRVLAAPGTLPRDIAAQIGLPGVTVRQVLDAVVLDGEVGSSEEARRAVEIAGIFAKKVVNNLTVRGVPTGDAAVSGQIQGVIGLPNVSVSLLGDTVLLEGTVTSAAQRTRAETIAGASGRKVLNLLELPTLTLEDIQNLISTPATANSDGTSLSVRQVGDQIIIEGTAANQLRIEQAIAAAGRSGLQVINRGTVLPPLTAEAQALRSIQLAIGVPGVTVSGTPKRLVLRGVVPDSNVAVAAEQIARSFAGEVDNMLQTPEPITVNVDIQIVEINSSAARQLGAQYGTVGLTQSTTPGSTTTVNGVTTLTPPTTTTTTDNVLQQGIINAGNGFFGGQGLQFLDAFRIRLNALYSNGSARLLSNPRTTVLSGRTATFQVGGQVPIPSGNTTGPAGTSTTIVFKDFGILMDVIPVANSNGVVTMRVRTEVSQPDPTLGVTPPGGGGIIPGFSRRSSITEVTVEPNGTLALGGLIQNNVTKSINKIPILGDIPILGALFRSKQFQRNQSELVVFVTPRVLPNPLAPGQTAFVGAFAAGNTTNSATILGNPGIASFNSGSSIVNASGAAQ